jgi:hypothetical protein
MRGDLFCRRLAREAAHRLNPGGYFQMICDWPHIRGTDPTAFLAEWFDDVSCDVLALRLRTLDPLAYASHWITSEASHNRTLDADRLIRSWTDFYAAGRFEAISLGIVTLRKFAPGTCRPHWFLLHEAPAPIVSPAGDQILRWITAQDLLRSCTDQSLLARSFSVPPDVRLSSPGQGRSAQPGQSIGFTRGFALAAPADQLSVAMFSLLGTPRTGSDLLAAIRQTTIPSLSDRDFLAALRSLVTQGLLT